VQLKIIIENQTECYICKRTGYLEEHHIFKGYNRKYSENYGLKVKLCPTCHRSEQGIHGRDGAKLDRRLKVEFQGLFEKTHSREEFMKLIGKNYI